MLGLFLRKLCGVLPTFIGITLLAFFLIRLVPGDPLEVMAGERQLDPAVHAAMMHNMGLDRPLLEQYGSYLGKLVQGDFGKSFVSREAVDRKSTRLNSSHSDRSRMPSSA